MLMTLWIFWRHDSHNTIDKHTLEEFVQLDDEHNQEYADAITTEIQ